MNQNNETFWCYLFHLFIPGPISLSKHYQKSKELPANVYAKQTKDMSQPKALKQDCGSSRWIGASGKGGFRLQIQKKTGTLK